MGPSRQKVLDTLSHDGLLLIDTVAERCSLSYSSARVHLRELRKAGMAVRTRRHGRDFYAKDTSV